MKTLWLFFVLTAATALACECAPISTKQAKKSAEIVFRGTVTEVSGGKVTFRVVRVWKGNLGPTFTMPDMEASAACLGFIPNSTIPGNDLLVYASRLHRAPDDDEYFSSTCTRTRSANYAAEDLHILGKGKPPHE